MGPRVLKGLKFDAPMALRVVVGGCAASLYKTFTTGLLPEGKTGEPPCGRGKPYNRAWGARKCTPSAYGTSPGGGGLLYA